MRRIIRKHGFHHLVVTVQMQKKKADRKLESKDLQEREHCLMYKIWIFMTPFSRTENPL